MEGKRPEKAVKCNDLVFSGAAFAFWQVACAQSIQVLAFLCWKYVSDLREYVHGGVKYLSQIKSSSVHYWNSMESVLKMS